MKKTLTTFAAAAAMAAGLAFAQTPEGAPNQTPAPAHTPSRRAAVRQRLMQALNLTDSQKQQAKTIFQQARETTKPIREQLKQNREALTAAVKAGNAGQIQQISTARGALLSQMVAAHAQARAQFYKLLTPEQKTKADRIAAHIRARMEQRAARRSTG